MGTNYKLVQIYIEKNGDLIVIPTGKSKKYFGAIKELDIINQLTAPYMDDELYTVLNKSLEQCFSIDPNDTTNLSSLERFLNVKGYSKAVKNKKLVVLQWNNKQGYYFTPTKKVPREGFLHLEDKAITLGESLDKEEFALALKEAAEMSS